MRISKSWLIALKDMKVFLRKRSALYSLVVFPIIVGIGLPLVLHFAGVRRGGLPDEALITLMNAFSFFYVIGAAILPTTLASYSLVGEKVEKSLEPFLATPVTDRELLLGKSIGAFIPPVATLYLSSIIFMVVCDLVTKGTLGYLYFPNWTLGLILLVVVPLSAVLSVEWSVIVSSRATDTRTAQMQGALIGLPLAGIYVATEVGAFTMDTNVLWIISGIFLILDIILFFLSTRIFRREEILTTWM